MKTIFLNEHRVCMSSQVRSVRDMLGSAASHNDSFIGLTPPALMAMALDVMAGARQLEFNVQAVQSLNLGGCCVPHSAPPI